MTKATMKAALYKLFGGPEVVHVVNDCPKPTLSKDNVLVEVHAASLNPLDWKARKGLLRPVNSFGWPKIPGGDFSGVVSAVGKKVTDFKPGDEVFGNSDAIFGSGSFAEYVAVSPSKLARKPASVSHTEAACLGIAAQTPYQAFYEVVKVRPGQNVLVHGGAGGTGCYAIQLAKLAGATVFTTCSGPKEALVRSLGADQVIDYTKQNFTEVLKDMDVVFHTIGLGNWKDVSRNFKVLRHGGVVLDTTAAPGTLIHQLWDHRVKGIFLSAKAANLAKLAALAEEKKLRTVIDKEYPLEEIVAAFKYMEAGHATGKIVIKIK
mmetsp:Transcript_7664/g.13106  ORF Transcript_7664/g.13106 Transcript_7664/m.13106 type:complete len:320 (-) Transcript_7664:727-1686(-)|eukprot:CAMPEP_0196666496 /NCGR_PEP_ID=MMETSP1086-20130531/64542_1 /TAXON_ID=77921 /ORGANISM="Cyanoptyche  gloeocystis , Strain SAG4.97" /LENGTH=319 /DNA_ID=CAMNT_0042003691 /DNA_START=81 /DNA_END=1040 /DNA_ORIENTATION=+